jgi:hypothetical protein
MEESKKSFMLYLDSKNVWDKMSNERAGILIKAIFTYQVNGTIVDNLEEKGLDLIMESLISQFKRDNEKWDIRAAANRENGKKGGRPKNNPDNPVGFVGSKNNPDNPTEPKKPVIVRDREKEIETVREVDNKFNKYKEDFSQFDFSLFMSGDEKKDIERRSTLLRILKRNYKQAQAVGTSYLDFMVSIQSHLYDRYKKGEDIFAAINNTISSGIKTIIAPKEHYVQLTPEERKKQKEEQLKKEERHNILSNYCIGVTYDEAMAQLNKNKRDRMRHFPFRPQEVITKVECDRYKIKYPTKRQWEIFNTEKEKYLLKAGGFTEGDCK